MTEWFFVVAAVTFWLSWLLMPGVGVTDPQQIFDLVASQRPVVACSVVLQLFSSVCYIPALLGLVADRELGRAPAIRRSAGLLIAGAMGSAADAVLHLLAFAMTTPGLERGPLTPVMAFMQGPGLLLLAPLIASFFVGGAALAASLAADGIISRWNLRLQAAAPTVAVAGGLLARSGFVPSRVVGLMVLGIVAAAQVWIGVALSNRRVTACDELECVAP